MISYITEGQKNVKYKIIKSVTLQVLARRRVHHIISCQAMQALLVRKSSISYQAMQDITIYEVNDQ